MNLPWPWQCLDLDQSASVAAVRRRYAVLLKLNRPEDNPDGFQQLRRAYEICLAFAREQETTNEAQASDGNAEVAATAITADRVHETAAPPSAHATVDAAADTSPAQAPPLVGAEPTESRRGDSLAAIAVPALRPPDAVIDELLAVDARTPHDSDAFARWFAECPEFASFVSRDIVELELLHRIATGARPTLRALQLFGAAFGWRQLGFDRHMLQIGVPHDQLRAVDVALFEAGAEAQYIRHLQTRRQLIPAGQDTLDADGELALLQRLHERRDAKPRFRETLSSSRLTQINTLLRCYSEHYGNAAALHLFGSDNVTYWRNAFPGSEPNRLQSLSSIVRALIIVGWVMLGLVGASFALNRKPFLTWLDDARFLLQAVAVIAAPILVIVCTGRLIALRARQALAQFDARYEDWQQHRIVPWLSPGRGLPLSLLLGLACGAIAYFAGTLAGLAGAVAATALIFGWRSLAPYCTAAAFLTFGLVPLSGDDLPAALAVAVCLAPALVWFADWHTRREQPRATIAQRTRRAVALVLCIAVVLMVGGWILAGQMQSADDSDARTVHPAAGADGTTPAPMQFPKSPRAMFSCAPLPQPGVLA
ncbi:hypothetical protein [Tahibacter sp.]|uniref:hypothetical protein n=1 Tax=Tahibacter sp. TaxID=2056211 RepID=UPI0028C496E7|nr:hypothetical protein [Tahibacter sp.]